MSYWMTWIKFRSWKSFVNYTENDFNGTARQTDMKMKKMKKIILDHVKNKCKCIL